MNLDALFSAAGALAVAGWIALVVATLLRRPTLGRIAAGLVIPLALSAVYAALVLAAWPTARGGYGSLAEVAMLFETREILLAGWIHYLAFDLLVGVMLAEKNETAGIPRLLMMPVFVATFLFGPAGFLLFQALRTVAGRRPVAWGTA